MMVSILVDGWEWNEIGGGNRVVGGDKSKMTTDVTGNG